jgi:AbrB family looped-hinge helix DNA binding protein
MLAVAKGAIAKLTSRGRVTLPQSVRERLGLQPGELVEFVEEDGTFRIPEADS